MKTQRMVQSCALALTLGSMLGCGASTVSSSSEAGNAAFNSAISTLTTSLTALEGLNPGGASLRMALSKSAPNASRVHSVQNLADIWDVTAWMPHPMCSGGGSDPHCQVGSNTVDLKEWMGYQLNTDAARDNGSSINIFGRLKQSMRIACALMNLYPKIDANGYPEDGTETITFTSSGQSILISKCNFDSSDVPDVGASISATASTPSDTSVYDKKIVLTLPAEMGGATQTFMMKMNDSVINIANAEDGTYVSRTLVAMDRVTKVTRVEYISGAETYGDSGYNFSRLFYDEINDLGAILSSEGDFHAGTPNQIIYSLKGKPTAGGEGAYSARIQGYGGSTDFDDSYNACVNLSNGNISSDSTLTCAGGVTGTSVNAVATDSLTDDVLTNIHTDADEYVDAQSMTETVTVPFTNSTNIYTTAFQYE